MTQMTRRGRPPLGLDRQYTLRLSPEQMAYLDSRADREDRTVAQILRRIVAEEMARTPLGEREPPAE